MALFPEGIDYAEWAVDHPITYMESVRDMMLEDGYPLKQANSRAAAWLGYCKEWVKYRVQPEMMVWTLAEQRLREPYELMKAEFERKERAKGYEYLGEKVYPQFHTYSGNTSMAETEFKLASAEYIPGVWLGADRFIEAYEEALMDVEPGQMLLSVTVLINQVHLNEIYYKVQCTATTASPFSWAIFIGVVVAIITIELVSGFVFKQIGSTVVEILKTGGQSMQAAGGAIADVADALGKPAVTTMAVGALLVSAAGLYYVVNRTGRKKALPEAKPKRYPLVQPAGG